MQLLVVSTHLNCRAMAALGSFHVLPCRVSPIAQATGRIRQLACTVQVGPFTEQTVDALVSAIGVYSLLVFARTRLVAHSTHGDAPGNVHYSKRDDRLHSLAAHPNRSQIML